MAATFTTGLIRRPPPDVRPQARSGWAAAGVALGITGLVVAMVTLVLNVVTAGQLTTWTANTVTRVLAWSFALTTSAFGTLKIGIAVVLVGIIVKLWTRVDSVKAALPRLKQDVPSNPIHVSGDIETAYGPAQATPAAPEPLLIHRLARTLWLPMLAMGAMAVLAGAVLAGVQSDRIGADAELARQLSAWVQGVQFLGEAFLLAGISFLLGTILGSLRAGGGEVQESAGVAVETLKMPVTAKLFVGLMMVGVVLGITQFALYLVAAYAVPASAFASWAAWLGPARELALGVLLVGIVLALATIARVLGFQFSRIREIITTGL